MKYGAIALVGKPNVGKSTIINKIFHESIAIVNKKPQTTRNQIAKIYTSSDFKILFIDTPGFHKENNELDKFLNGEIYRALKLAPIVFVISDLTREFNEEDAKIAKKLQQLKDKKFVLIFNKSDEISSNQLSEVKRILKTQWTQYLTFCHEIVTNQDDFEIENILKKINSNLENQEDLINFIELNLDDEFLVKEIIRNVLLKLFRQEIPYSVAIKVLSFLYDAKQNDLVIKADIFVNKASQKPILIGKSGRMIKQIGINSRIELAKIYDCNVNLFLDVKVKENWKNNETYLKDFGYIIKK